MRRFGVLILACLLATGCSRLVDVSIAEIDAEPLEAPQQSLVFAADGTQIATLRLAHRVNVQREDLPDVLVDALVAAEDRRFFAHNGVDARAIARAALANQRAGQVVQGGSTITQQLVKNRYFPEAEETLGRKADEAVLALELEETHTKDEILVDYLNTIYFGAGAYGIEAAAQTYFGIATAELDLAQAALLVGLIRSPETASPHRAPERAVAERQRVLDALVATGGLAREQAARVTTAPLGVRESPAPPVTRYPYFVEHVKRSLLADPALGPDEATRVRRLFGGGLRIHTTIDPALQALAEETAASFLPDPDDPEVAIAVVDHAAGTVVASVGGRDFGTRQFDLASQARRQPGSTFKTFALVAALEEGWRLDDTIESGSLLHERGPHDEPWQVRSTTSGQLDLEDALARSSNGAFARLGLELEPARVAQQARALGITSDVGANPALVLGGLREGVSPLELATAYGTLANGGVLRRPRVVTRVEDPDGGVVLERESDPHVATGADTAWTTTRALRTVIEEGTGQAADIGRPAAGKTGTSQEHRDAWFVGYTPELTAAVWVGYPDAERPLLGVRGFGRVAGGTFPARMWASFMSAALAGTPVRDFAYPEHLEVTVEIDPESGKLATEWCPHTVEVTGVPTDLPTTACPLHGPPPPPEPTPTQTAAPSPTPVPTPEPSPVPTPTPAPSPETPAATRSPETPAATRSPEAPAQTTAPAPSPTAAEPATPTPTPTGS